MSLIPLTQLRFASVLNVSIKKCVERRAKTQANAVRLYMLRWVRLKLVVIWFLVMRENDSTKNSKTQTHTNTKILKTYKILLPGAVNPINLERFAVNVIKILLYV